MCAAAMTTAGFEGRSRLQLPPFFWSLLIPSSSLLTQHPRRSTCSWSVSVFFLGKRERAAACSWPPIWGRGKVTLPFSLHLYPLLNESDVFGCWISLVPVPLLSYPRLVPIPILP